MSAVNALSEWCEVTVCQNGKRHYQRYERGVPCAPLKEVGDSDCTGTTTKYLADSEIFGDIVYHPDIFVSRLRELAYLNKGMTIAFTNELAEEGEEKTSVFHYKNGIAEFVEHLNRNKNPLHKVVYFAGEREETSVEVALQYNESFQENILTFANNIHTQEGGTHLSGFKTAITRVINNYARKANILKEKDPNLQGDDVREGLAACHIGQALTSAVRGPDQDQAGKRRGRRDRELGGGRKAGRVLRGKPHSREEDHRKGPHRAQGPRSRAQGR